MPDTRSVFILWQGSYEDRGVVAVFADRQLAEDHMAVLGVRSPSLADDYDITEDELITAPPTLESYVYARLTYSYATGKIFGYGCRTYQRWSYEPFEQRVYRGASVSDLMAVIAEAMTEDQALDLLHAEVNKIIDEGGNP